MTPDKPGKRNDGAADPDASDLDGLIAERDRVRAELERILGKDHVKQQTAK